MYQPVCAECGQAIKFALIVLLCDSCLLQLSIRIKDSKAAPAVCLETVWEKEAITDCGRSLPCQIHKRELHHA